MVPAPLKTMAKNSAAGTAPSGLSSASVAMTMPA